MGSVTACTLAKYWSKFSSQVSTVPHGVMPPAQLFSIPRTRVPVGSSDVCQQVGSGRGAGQLHRCLGGDPAVQRVSGHHAWPTSGRGGQVHDHE